MSNEQTNSRLFIYAVSLALLSWLSCVNVFAQGPLKHVLDKASAVSLARSQGKGVFMVQGASTCGDCAFFEESTMLVDDIGSPVKSLLDEAFVYWYCSLDTQPGTNIKITACPSEVRPYIEQTAKYPSYTEGNLTKNYDLPLLIFIDPREPNVYKDEAGGLVLKPMAGGPGAYGLYQYFLVPAAHSIAGPIFSNIKDGDVISDSAFEVTGRSRWAYAVMPKVGYRLNGGTWRSKATVPCKLATAGSGVASICPATWSLPISLLDPRKGVNTLEVRAEWLREVPQHGVSSTIQFVYK